MSDHRAYDVHVGKVVSAHGLRGQLKVAPITDIPERWESLHEVMVRTARSATLYRVKAAREAHPGTWLVSLEGIEDRTAAEALRGAQLLVREDDSPALPEGVYYTHQIIGLQVVTTDGRELGPVTDVIETGANDVYATAAALIPAIKQVIRKIDLQAGTMLIEPMPGLLEEG